MLATGLKNDYLPLLSFAVLLFFFIQEKKRNYEKQKERMQRRESSFLDSIRMDVDNPIDEEF